MNIPSGFTQAEISQLTAANPGVIFALPTPVGTTIPADVAPTRVLGWLDILGPALEAGEAIVLPGPIGVILASLTKSGLAALQASLASAAITERWTVEKIQQEIASNLVTPKT
jgi:hypothetical protein